MQNNKLIVDKNECVEACVGEYRFEFEDKCYKACPPNTFYKIITFDSNGFFGDVYNFETYYTQETVFDLTEFTNYPIVNI